MSKAPRLFAVLSAAFILTAVTPTAEAAPQGGAPEPVRSCQVSVEADLRAVVEIASAERHATLPEKRTLHLELVQLRRDHDLEPSTC
jgi:hypothetical protein